MKRKYVTLKQLFFAILALCLICFGLSMVMKKHPEKYQNVASDIEEGMSTLKHSKDGMFNYRVELSSNKILIVAVNNDSLKHPKKDVVIPSMIDGRKVAYLDDISSDAMVTITLPDSLEKIRGRIDSRRLKTVTCKGTHLTFVSKAMLMDFKGTVYTKKGSKLWDYCQENKINVKEVNA